METCSKRIVSKEGKTKGDETIRRKIKAQSNRSKNRDAVQSTSQSRENKALSLIEQFDQVDKEFEQGDNITLDVDELEDHDRFPEESDHSQQVDYGSNTDSESERSDDEDLNQSVDLQAEMLSRAGTVYDNNVVTINDGKLTQLSVVDRIKQYERLRGSDPAFDSYIKQLVGKQKEDGMSKSKKRGVEGPPKNHSGDVETPNKGKGNRTNSVKSPSDTTLYNPALKQLAVASPQGENILISRMLMQQAIHV